MGVHEKWGNGNKGGGTRAASLREQQKKKKKQGVKIWHS
jgi:hypothetical protein